MESSLSPRPCWGLLCLGGCASPQSPDQQLLPNRQALIGKTRHDLLACASSPIRETRQGERLILTYYKEAPMPQGSFFTSKASRRGVDHGCWAEVLLEGDRVTDIGYQSVPRGVDALDKCEEIFGACRS